MGFELPAALLGLLGAAVPILAHLVRRRDLPTVPLPTVALLSRATARSRRSIALRDLLLLLVRVLLVLALGLAIARPYVRVPAAIGDGRVASLGVVLDDSMSMGAEVDGGRAFDRARATAIDALAALPAGSEVSVALAGRPARLLVPRTSDRSAAVRALRALPSPLVRGTDLEHAVAMAVRQVEASALPLRRLLVVSDFAAGAVPPDLAFPSSGMDVVLVRIGEDAPPNRSVVDAVVAPDPATSGGYIVHASVRTTLPESAVDVRLRGEEGVLDEARWTVAGGRAEGALRAPPRADGEARAAWVELVASDALALDDRRAVLLGAPSGVHVILVDGDPHPDRAHDEVGFLARALDSAPRGGSALGYRTVDPETLSPEVLADADVVVLAHVASPSTALARRLAAFVDEGGGLLVTPGDRFSAAAYASLFGDLLPAHPGAASAPAEGVTLRARDGGLLPDGTTLDTVRLRRRLLLEARASSEVALELSDGTPALVLGTHGAGRTALLATTLDDAWGDLPYHPAFLALVVELMRRLAGDVAVAGGPFVPGDAVPLPAAGGLAVVSPEGVTVPVDDDRETPFLAPAVPGVHAVLAGSEPRPHASFVVTFPAAEGNLARDPLPTVGGTSPALSASTVRTLRRPLAPLLFLAAALLAVAEGILRSPPALRRRRALPR